jgi:ribosomal protein L24
MLAAFARNFGYKAKQVRFTDWKIVRGDTVLAIQVILRCGRDKSKTGVVEKVYRNSNQVLVKDINIVRST